MKKNSNQLLSSCQQTFKDCFNLIEKKNKDYAGIGNPYANFEFIEQLGISTQIGIVVRLTDKFKRISNLLTVEAFVVDESIDDTINDAINYLAILKARRQYEKGIKK